MQCMKCGKEIPEDQVFCDDCLDIMSRYPVKPGTPVQILPRTPKTAKKRGLSPEEQILKQKSTNRKLRLLVLLLSIALAGVLGILLYTILPGSAGLL